MTVITIHSHFWEWKFAKSPKFADSIKLIWKNYNASNTTTLPVFFFFFFCLKCHSVTFGLVTVMTVTGMTKVMLTSHFSLLSWCKKLEIFRKNLKKFNIPFQSLGLFDFQYFALIDKLSVCTQYLPYRTDKLSVCTQYLPKIIIQICSPCKLLLKCIFF